MSLTLEQLKEKKRILEDKKAALKAEEKYLEEEKTRLLTKLRELGFSTLAEAKAALSDMEKELSEKESQLEDILSDLENSSVEKPVVNQPLKETHSISINSIDDL